MLFSPNHASLPGSCALFLHIHETVRGCLDSPVLILLLSSFLRALFLSLVNFSNLLLCFRSNSLKFQGNGKETLTARFEPMTSRFAAQILSSRNTFSPPCQQVYREGDAAFLHPHLRIGLPLFLGTSFATTVRRFLLEIMPQVGAARLLRRVSAVQGSARLGAFYHSPLLPRLLRRCITTILFLILSVLRSCSSYSLIADGASRFSESGVRCVHPDKWEGDGEGGDRQQEPGKGGVRDSEQGEGDCGGQLPRRRLLR